MRTGLYDQIQQKYNMSDPHCLFDINYLKQNPTPFFDFAKVHYTSSFLSLILTLSHFHFYSHLTYTFSLSPSLSLSFTLTFTHSHTLNTHTLNTLNTLSHIHSHIHFLLFFIRVICVLNSFFVERTHSNYIPIPKRNHQQHTNSLNIWNREINCFVIIHKTSTLWKKFVVSHVWFFVTEVLVPRRVSRAKQKYRDSQYATKLWNEFVIHFFCHSTLFDWALIHSLSILPLSLLLNWE
jgi:hypothetical protein